jgi:hypothetical protein
MVDMAIERNILPQAARTGLLLTFASACLIEQAHRVAGSGADIGPVWIAAFVLAAALAIGPGRRVAPAVVRSVRQGR